ncbi:hypothetical protein ACLOJK_015751 [Asimina triloba]
MGFFSSISFSKSLPICLLAFVIATCHSSPTSAMHLRAFLCLSSSATGHVTGLYLNELSLSGEINFESLHRIRSLQVLNLAYNRFYPSPFHSAIGKLTSLAHLNLSHTKVYAEIPLEMSCLTRLVSLDLSGNGYYDDGSNFIPLKSKSIGSVIRNLSRLRELYVDFVDMSAEGSQWSLVISSGPPSLRVLSMYNCSLSGTILPSISPLHRLSHLNLGSNSFSSMPLDSFRNLLPLKSLTNLEYLDLSENSLHGIIPSSFFTLPSLRSLVLGGNQLGGQLSEFHNSSSLTKLEYLDLSQNNLSGTIPSSMFTLPSLRFLYLEGNQLVGQPSKFPNSSSSLAKLEYLDLSENNFYGRIPSSLFTLPPSLQSLRLWGNRLSGQLSEFHNSSSSLLYHIDLSQNQLQGMLPRSITQLTKLEVLILDYNYFTTVPDMNIFTSFKNLSYLDLSSNKLEGSLPIPPPSIIVFRFADNHLSGEIPISICNSSSLDTFDISGNN